MANPYKFGHPSKGSAVSSTMGEPLYVQGAEVTLGGSGTTTAFTFAALSLYDMGNTSYNVQCTPLGATSEPIRVTTRTATGFTITHEDGISIAVAVQVTGTAKAA